LIINYIIFRLTERIENWSNVIVSRFLLLIVAQIFGLNYLHLKGEKLRSD